MWLVPEESSFTRGQGDFTRIIHDWSHERQMFAPGIGVRGRCQLDGKFKTAIGPDRVVFPHAPHIFRRVSRFLRA